MDRIYEKRNKKMKRVNILLPLFGFKPVGGFKIAYIYANHLASKGYHVTVIHEICADLNKNPKYFIRYCKGIKRICLEKKRWFRFRKGVHCKYVIDLNKWTVPQADITIATAWKTAVVLNKLENVGRKIYLIQHYEIWDGKKADVDATWHYDDMDKIVISKWLLDIGNAMNCSKLTYIPNALDFHKYRMVHEIESRSVTVSMLYSNSQFKDSATGLKTLKKVKEQVPQLRVRLFGVNKRSDKIPKWMKYEENPKQDILVGEIYNGSAVFLCTSIVEGWGLPPMEAMACGCAVVTTDNGGIRDFAINEKTALVRDVKDVDALANAIIELLLNPDKRIKLAYAGMEYVKKFTWKNSFDRFDKLLES